MALSDLDVMSAWEKVLTGYKSLGERIFGFARAIEAEARRDALEEAAKVCESQWSNVAEKMYGTEMAAAIRALKETIQ